MDVRRHGLNVAAATPKDQDVLLSCPQDLPRSVRTARWDAGKGIWMDQEALTDAEVIVLSERDPARFELIFRRHFGAIHLYVQRRAGPALADDLTAETFATAFRQRETYDRDRESAQPWLFGIATNLLRHHWRGERRRLIAYARTGINPVNEGGFEAADERMAAAAAEPVLALGLASLKPWDRDVLLLFAWADLSYPEIADALGIPVGTVRSRLSRARRILRELLDANGQVLGRDALREEVDHG